MASGGQERKPSSAELQESQSSKKGSKTKSPKSGKDKKKTTVAECDRVIEITDEELAELQAQEALQPPRGRRDVSVPKQRSGVFGFLRKEASRHEPSEKSDKTPKQAVEKTPKTPEKGDSAQAISLSPGASAQPGRSSGMQSGGDTEDESEGTKKDRSSKKSPSIFKKFFKPRSRDTSPEKTLTSPHKGVSPGKKSGFRGKKSGTSPGDSGQASPGSSPSTPTDIKPEECISSLVTSTHVCASGPILAKKDKRSLFSPSAKSARNIPVIVEVEEVPASSSSTIPGYVPPAIEETSQLHLTLGSPLGLNGERDPNMPSVETIPVEQDISTQHTQPLGLSGERDPDMPSVGRSPSEQDISTQHTQPLGLSGERDPNMPTVGRSPSEQDIPTQHTQPLGLRVVRDSDMPSVGRSPSEQDIPTQHKQPLGLSGEREPDMPSVGTGPVEQDIPTQDTQPLGLSGEREPDMPSVGTWPSEQDIPTQHTLQLELSGERDPNILSVGRSPSEQDIPTQYTLPLELSVERDPNMPSVGTWPSEQDIPTQQTQPLGPRDERYLNMPSVGTWPSEQDIPTQHTLRLELSGERDPNMLSVGTSPVEEDIPTQHTQPLGLSGERDPNMPSVGTIPVEQDIPTQHTQPLGLSGERDPNMPSVETIPVEQDIPTQHTPAIEVMGVRIENIPSVGAAQDLSAFDMPLISSNIPENMAESSEYDRPRSSSGSTALKGLLTSKSKRNKSVDREDKKEKDKDKDKKRGFFEQFRPRSKSDVSGLKRPAKKSSLPTDRSMDESALTAQSNLKSLTGSQEFITPMSQILEGQMLNVPDEDRTRHKSGSSGARDGSFMSKIRTFSTSETKPPKSPKRPIQSQRSLSPPASPRADRAGLSPLRLQSGEPRSAPPGLLRGSVFSEREQSHVPYRPDVLNRMAAEFDHRMDVEETDDNIDQAFSKFMRSHKCYDIIPTSAKLVIFDTHLNVKKAFFALIYNDVRAAPLWDTALQEYVGMLTISDFIAILRRLYVSPSTRMDELEDHKILEWRDMQGTRLQPFICIGPDASLYDAVKSLVENRVHRLPVVDEASGNALYILTHKRILRFLYMFLRNLRTPSFMHSSLLDLGIGTYTNVITTTPETHIITALDLFTNHRVSALPVVNNLGEVINIYAKFDVIALAAAKSYTNLNVTIEEALKNRKTGEGGEPVATCFQSETLSAVIERIVKAEVHRLIIVDEGSHVKGILSLSDILKYIILRPMGEDTSAVATEHAPEDQPPLEPAIVEEASLLEPELMGAEASESSQALS